MTTYGFKTNVTLVMDHEEGSLRSRHLETTVSLELSAGLRREAYITENGSITRNGIIAIANTLIQGLVHCGSSSEKMGYLTKEEFRDFVLKELELKLTKGS